MGKQSESTCTEAKQTDAAPSPRVPGKVSLGGFELPPPTVVGLGPTPAVPKRLERPAGPLFALENQVKDDYERLKHAHYDLHSADDYVARVERTFGSLRAYLDWAPRSDQLLERQATPKRKVRELVELKGDEQRVFFRWVSWHYHAHLHLGDDDIVSLIAKGIDPRMAGAIRGAEAALHHGIHVQGANPRPMKNSKGQYRLGTMSEHATGMAVDIDPARNPILGAHVWIAILRATNTKADLGLGKWIRDPGAYYDAIATVDDLWSRKVDNAVAARRWTRSHPHALGGEELARPANGVPRLELGKPAILVDDATDVIRELLGPSAGAAATTLAALPRYHFLGHSKDLVLALRDQGLRWGATFYPDNVDLHHFELPQPPLPAVK